MYSVEFGLQMHWFIQKKKKQILLRWETGISIGSTGRNLIKTIKK